MAAGLDEETAKLGRDVMREASQHGWPHELWEECGWDGSHGIWDTDAKGPAEGSNAKKMLDRALDDPEAAYKRWKELWETDGGKKTKCFGD